MSETIKRAGVLLLIGAVLGCSKIPPPKELVTARADYAKAQKGLAAKLAPADLDTAKQALDAAEAAFDAEPEEQRTRDLAYIADRRALLAEAAGGTESANRRREAAERAYKEVTQTELKLARAKVAKSKEQLEKERREREKAEVARDSAERARASMEKDLRAALDSIKEIASIKEEARGVVITLSGAVLFASGRATLLPIAKSKLDQVAESIKHQGSKKLIVEGHTDSVGPITANMRLSQQRADAVREHLIGRGIPSGDITAVGIGPDRPVAENTSPEGRANNRRVEIIVK